MQQIRLNKTKEVESALKLLRKKRYPILSDSEILKLLLGLEYSSALNEEVEILSKEDSKEVQEGMKELESGKLKGYKSVNELFNDLDKN